MFQKLQRVGLSVVVLVLVLVSTVTAAPPNWESFIVVFHGSVGNPAAVASELAQRAGGQVGFVYEHALKGFSIELPGPAAAGLRNDPRVAYVEADLPMQITQTSSQVIPTEIQRMYASGNTNLKIDGSDERVDVDVAVVDTGIDLQHPDLNVVGGIDCTLKRGNGPFATYYCGTGNGGDDDHYHGTHVAGTIAALDNGIGVVGVAPGARLWAVKVLNSQGSGYTSGIVAGIDWVVDQGNIEVINMSLGGSGISTAYETAIDNAVASGVIVVVAAGNSDDDANNYSPAYVPSAITVSALADFNGLAGGGAAATCRADIDDTLADFSNWGSAVDIAAPGVCILSTYPREQGYYGTISGTSMASPHVAGAAALLASNNYPRTTAGVQAIRNVLVDSGNLAWSDDSGDGIQEKLLDVRTFTATFVGGGGNTAPIANFTFGCPDLACTFTDTSTDSGGSVVSWAWTFGDGSTSTAQSPNHTYVAAGTYTVGLTVTDNGGATGSTSQSVTVTAPPAIGMHVGDLDGSAVTGSKGQWNATVSVTIHNGSHGPVAGAIVNGSWSSGSSVSCTTIESGQCTITVNNIKGGSVTWTVTNVLSNSLTYQPSANHDPDGDSNGSSIVIAKP